jgi:hypothetical protein
MDHLADRLDRAADTLSTIDHRLPALAVDAVAFGAQDAGIPGRLGRDLHGHWSAVLDARAREAAGLAARLAEAAGAVRTTARQYTETDATVARRFAGERGDLAAAATAGQGGERRGLETDAPAGQGGDWRGLGTDAPVGQGGDRRGLGTDATGVRGPGGER